MRSVGKVGIIIVGLSFSILSLLIFTATVDRKTVAFKLTATSYGDGFTRGLDDATCDLNQCHGHGYNSSCPSGHTKTFCSGYAQGYNKEWVQQSGNEQSKSQAQSIGENDLGINGNNNHVIINQVQNQK